MRKVLFHWRRVPIYSYPFFLYVGTVLGILAGMWGAARRGTASPRMYIALVLLVIPALVGARWLFLLSHWAQFRRHDVAPPRRWEGGGAALYGGLLLALALSPPLLWLLRIPLGQFWDVATITILVGMVFTKIGCMLNGCCVGRETSSWFALYLPNIAGVWRRRVPSQLLESALAAALLLSVPILWNRVLFPGAFFLMALAVYALSRLWLESTRENIDSIGRYSLHRVISFLLVAFSVTGLVLLSIAIHAKP